MLAVQGALSARQQALPQRVVLNAGALRLQRVQKRIALGAGWWDGIAQQLPQRFAAQPVHLQRWLARAAVVGHVQRVAGHVDRLGWIQRHRVLPLQGDHLGAMDQADIGGG